MNNTNEIAKMNSETVDITENQETQPKNWPAKLGSSWAELLVTAAFISFLALAYYLTAGKKNNFDEFLDSVNAFVANHSQENLNQLKKQHSQCWADNTDADAFSLDFHVACTTRVYRAADDGRLNINMLFNALASSNNIYSAIEMGFFDNNRLLGHSSAANAYTLNYEGEISLIQKLKAIELIRNDKPRLAYSTLIKAFYTAKEMKEKHEIASIARGILDGFGCVNDMKVWENYSVTQITFGYTKSTNNGDSPLPIETIKTLRTQLDNGTAPELQESCALKNYKL